MCGYVNTGLMEYDNFDDTLFFNTTIADDYPRRIAQAEGYGNRFVFVSVSNVSGKIKTLTFQTGYQQASNYTGKKNNIRNLLKLLVLKL